jgi:hypothetical protein
MAVAPVAGDVASVEKAEVGFGRATATNLERRLLYGWDLWSPFRSTFTPSPNSTRAN